MIISIGLVAKMILFLCVSYLFKSFGLYYECYFGVWITISGKHAYIFSDCWFSQRNMYRQRAFNSNYVIKQFVVHEAVSCSNKIMTATV